MLSYVIPELSIPETDERRPLALIQRVTNIADGSNIAGMKCHKDKGSSIKG
jgi:hypothetical protein